MRESGCNAVLSRLPTCCSAWEVTRTPRYKRFRGRITTRQDAAGREIVRGVPTSLTIDQHLAALRDAVSAFARHAQAAGLDVPVPTCPDWTVRRLIGHQGMVHRWAAANLRGSSIEIDATERAGRRAPSPVDWLRDGAIDLVAAITEAPDDVRTIVFLNDAPPAAARSGRGGSATRPPSTRSTRCRRRSAATRRRATPGSTRPSRSTASTSCCAAS